MNDFNNEKYMFLGRPQLRIIGEELEENRNSEIGNLVTELNSYKVLLRDLVNYETSYELRNEFLNIAFYVIEDLFLYEKFIDSKELPIEDIFIKVGKPKKYIIEWADYIISYIVIFGSPSYSSIQEYMNVVEVDKSKQETKEVQIGNNITDNKGILIGKNKVNGVLLTLSGEFKRVKVKKDLKRGMEIDGVSKKGIKDFKIYLSIIAIIIVLLGVLIASQYTRSITTVVVSSTITLKVEVNPFNRIIEIESNDTEGKKLINDIKVLDENFDIALERIIEYLDKKELISSIGVVVTISGEPIEYDSISKTEDYIYVNNIDIKFNNSGIEHKID